ncbi:MBL fold metallo-hydrolase [Terrisporobacter sp.]
MKIKENIYLLKLPTMNPEDEEFIYPILIKNNDDLTLIDTGFPGQIELLKFAIEKEGFDFSNLKSIILTHHDIDHMGNVKPILQLLPKTKLILLEDEVGYINGSKKPCKLEMIEKYMDKLDEGTKKLYPMLKYFFDNNKLDTDKLVKDGDIIDKGEKMKVIATPGHTVGHMSLYIEKYKLLIAGDLFVIENNQLANCERRLNYNQKVYLESVENIKNLDIERIICYHGGDFIC